MIKKHEFTSRKPIFRENMKIGKLSYFFKILEEYFSFSSKNPFSTCKTRFSNKIHESAQFRAETEKKAKKGHFGSREQAIGKLPKKNLEFLFES